jgi:uncharacterized membrane protein
MGKRSTRQQTGGQGSVHNGPNRSSARNPKAMALLDFVVLLLAVAGILLTAYLTYASLFEAHPAFCGEGSGCDLVQSSRWATLLGVPMALWGLLTYAGIAGLAWRGRRKPGSWTVLLMVAVCGFAISAYLTVMSVVAIQATCAYCLASFAIITVLMILAVVRQPPEWARSFKEAVVIGLVIVGGLHLHYSGWFDKAAGPEDPQLRALAVHLSEIDAKFYGAYWCPSCQEQKAVFEASANRLPYVECSSGGRGSALTAPCVKENIRNYPTWIIGEKRLTGVKTPRELASVSEFPWQE